MWGIFWNPWLICLLKCLSCCRFWFGGHIPVTPPSCVAARPRQHLAVLHLQPQTCKTTSAFTFKRLLKVSQLLGAKSKSAYKDRGKQIQCWAPLLLWAQWQLVFYLCTVYSLGFPRLRHSMGFRRLEGAVRQKFACYSTSSPHHAIGTKFIRALLRRAPAGSQVSRQFAERNWYSLQVHIIVAVIFLEHREGNDQSKGHHRRSTHPYAAADAICVGKITGLRRRRGVKSHLRENIADKTESRSRENLW